MTPTTLQKHHQRIHLKYAINSKYLYVISNKLKICMQTNNCPKMRHKKTTIFITFEKTQICKGRKRPCCFSESLGNIGQPKCICTPIYTNAVYNNEYTINPLYLVHVK
jgi:hypothetical protein